MWSCNDVRSSSAPTPPASPTFSTRSVSSTMSPMSAAGSRKPSGGAAVSLEYAPWQPVDTRMWALAFPWAMTRRRPAGNTSSGLHRTTFDAPSSSRRPSSTTARSSWRGRTRRTRPTRRESRRHTWSRSTSTGDFRELVDFMGSVRYRHIVPQLVRDPDRSIGRENDPYGGDFLDQLARTPGQDPSVPGCAVSQRRSRRRSHSFRTWSSSETTVAPPTFAAGTSTGARRAPGRVSGSCPTALFDCSGSSGRSSRATAPCCLRSLSYRCTPK